MKRFAKKSIISKACLSVCLIFSLNSCQMGDSAANDLSAIKNIIEQDAERAYLQKAVLEETLQASYALNISKYGNLVNIHYKELNESINNILDAIDGQRKNLKNGKNADNDVLLNCIGKLQQSIDRIYEAANQEIGFHYALQKDWANTDITKVFPSKFFNDFDNSSKEVKDLLLTKLASDIINTEVTVTNNIYDAYKSCGCINTVLVVPEKSEYKVGENYEARIYLATKDTKKPAEIIANGTPVKDGHLIIPCTKVGENLVEGSYTLNKDDGTIVQYNFQSKYTVTKR